MYIEDYGLLAIHSSPFSVTAKHPAATRNSGNVVIIMFKGGETMNANFMCLFYAEVGSSQARQVVS